MRLDRNNLSVIPEAKVSLAFIRIVREKIETVLRTFCHNQNTVDDVLLATTEHLTNIVKHNGAEQSVSVDIQKCPMALLIKDSGDSIKSRLLSAQSMDLLTQGNAVYDSGMGLVTIKHLFPELQYQEKGPQQNFNTLLLPLEGDKPTLLLVDDDIIQLSVVKNYLESDYDVFSCSDVQDAHAVLNEKSIDLIICDINMPGKSGFEFRSQLLSELKYARLPFIFLTGDNASERQQIAGELEIDDFLEKPISKTKLLASIQRVLVRTKTLQSTFDAKLDEDITGSLWSSGPWLTGQHRIELAYQAASRGGGDFLYQTELAGKKRFILGDVMGHGEQAKFFAYAIRGLLHGLMLTIGKSAKLTTMMEALSNAMVSSPVLSKTIVTMLAIDITEDSNLEIVSAGHASPWLINEFGELSEIEVGGSLPGMVLGAQYHSVSLKIEPLESLLMFTDGLTEEILGLKDTHDPDKQREALIKLMSSAGGASASAVARDDNFSVGRLSDDVTLLSITPN